MPFVIHRKASLLAVATLLAGGFLTGVAVSPAHAQQTTVSYGNLGTFTQSGPLTVGGITATSSGVFSVTPNSAFDSGLGIVGGYGNVYIDNGESVLFTFDGGPATDVRVFTTSGYGSAGFTPSTVELFGVNNMSLGVFNYNSLNISDLVAGSSLSAFRLTGGTSSGVNVNRITYTPAISAVPEPSEYAVGGMFGATLLFGMVRARRKKAAQAK